MTGDALPSTIAEGGEIIDLGIGHLEDRLLPWGELADAATRRLAQPSENVLQYAPEEGIASTRRAIADFLRRRTATDLADTDLMLTNGASHGLDLVLSRYTEPGNTVFIEDPTYFFGLEVLQGRRLKLVPVPMDEHGLDIVALERLLERESPKLLYTIPVFHNPTGVTLSANRRSRLLELAREHNFQVIADEVYQMLVPRSQQPLPLRSYDRSRVISLGSFSKIFGPGLRLGWIEADPASIAFLREDPVSRSGGGANPITAAIMQAALDSGIQDQFLDQMIEIYTRRRILMIKLLRAELPNGSDFIEPAGGYYVWVRLAEHLDAAELSGRAHDFGVGFRAGRDFSCYGGFGNYLRLCFTFYDEANLEIAVQRLGKLLRQSK